MKILKIVGLVIVGILAILLIASFIVSNEMNYEKSITIAAPVEVVWENVNSLEDMNSWSPWTAKDPAMTQSISGTDGAVGAMHSWDSQMEEVGKGSQTITNLEPPTLVETDLKFYTPYESEAQAFIRLTDEGAATTATWGFYSEVPRPMNLMFAGADMDEMIGADYQQGLDQLKKMSEDMQANIEMEADMAMEADTVMME